MSVEGATEGAAFRDLDREHFLVPLPSRRRREKLW